MSALEFIPPGEWKVLWKWFNPERTCAIALMANLAHWAFGVEFGHGFSILAGPLAFSVATLRVYRP